jgi:hypothetical protein
VQHTCWLQNVMIKRDINHSTYNLYYCYKLPMILTFEATALQKFQAHPWVNFFVHFVSKSSPFPITFYAKLIISWYRTHVVKKSCNPKCGTWKTSGQCGTTCLVWFPQATTGPSFLATVWVYLTDSNQIKRINRLFFMTTHNAHVTLLNLVT